MQSQQNKNILADLEVVRVVGIEADHELIEAEFEVLEVGLVEGLAGDLVAHDLGADEVLVVQTQPHLLQQEVRLLSPLHLSECLNLQVPVSKLSNSASSIYFDCIIVIVIKIIIQQLND